MADDLLRTLVGRPGAADAASEGWQREVRAVTWRAMIERGADDPRRRGRDEAAARDAILSFARSRGVELTMLLLPLMPTTVTARARRTTLGDRTSARSTARRRASTTSRGSAPSARRARCSPPPSTTTSARCSATCRSSRSPGGADIVGCFVLGAPTLPVHRGESPCVGLGLHVRAHDGVEARRVGVGEMVCARPFPAGPVGLWGDADGARFHEAYFAAQEGLWTHGDLVELTARGAAVIHGRSDGVMNLRGVRVGPAEVYRALDDVREIAAMLATDQPWPDEPGGRRLVLLVELAAGCALDRPLTLRIKRLLKERASPVHVPAVVAQVSALPRTHTGKVSERAAQDALAGRAVRNRDALRDPSTLDDLVRGDERSLVTLRGVG